MVPTVSLVNTHHHTSMKCCVGVRASKTFSLGNFQIYNTVARLIINTQHISLSHPYFSATSSEHANDHHRKQPDITLLQLCHTCVTHVPPWVHIQFNKIA